MTGPQRINKFLRGALPHGLRVPVAAWFARNPWLPGAHRWAEGLVRDLEEVDPKAFHKFLWEHHLDRYGQAYQADDLFAARKLNSTTKAYDLFESDLRAALASVGATNGVRSVLDVGCSVGHVLRALETEVLTHASVMVGVDIDRPAIEAGAQHLARIGSKIELLSGDLEDLDSLLGDRRFDFSFAAGSLSYLNDEDAQNAVSSVLRRTDTLAAFIGLSNPVGPNSEMPNSRFRDDLGNMWTHNFERMVLAGGWEVLGGRWEPPSQGDSQGLYSVFACRPRAGRPAPVPRG